MKALILIALSLSSAAAVSQAEWSMGEERETSPGTYFSLFSEDNGWRVWKLETKNSVECMAVKPAIGQAQPMPYAKSYFDGPWPFVRISRNYSGAFKPEFVGRYGQADKWRIVGERFWTDGLAFGDLPALEGKSVDVLVERYRYPNIRADLATDKGVIDFLGVEKALLSLEKCGAIIR